MCSSSTATTGSSVRARSTPAAPAPRTCRSRSGRRTAVPIPFTKGHGLGNDYLVLDRADLAHDLTEPEIVRLCDRNWGIGSDGILLLVETTRADFGLRI